MLCDLCVFVVQTLRWTLCLRVSVVEIGGDYRLVPEAEKYLQSG